MTPFFLAGTAFVIAATVQPAESPAVPSPASLTYADLADLATGSPVAAHVRVRGASRLSAEEAPNVAAGHRRFLVEAEIVALIRGEGGLPQQVSYVVDLPNDARGRPTRIQRRAEMLILARRVPNRPAWLQLAAPDAQLPYTPDAAQRLRAILRDAHAEGAPPRITGIGRAFHVPGTLPGESETQFFLQTADDRPISLSVLRRPGQQPRWSVALAEIVDEAAEPPARDTFLWYRLACTLPGQLPAQALRDSEPAEAPAIQADYRVVMQGLGSCQRSRRPR